MSGTAAPPSLERQARRRARYTSGLLWHAGAFPIVGTGLSLIDARGPGGIDWAHLVLAPWAFALAFHALAWLIDGRDLEERLTRAYVERARRDDASGR